MPERAGQHRDADDAELVERGKAFVGEAGGEHAPLRFKGVDRERGDERGESVDSERVEHARGDDRERESAFADVGHRRALGVLLVGTPLGAHVYAGAGSQPLDSGGVRHQDARRAVACGDLDRLAVERSALRPPCHGRRTQRARARSRQHTQRP